MDAPEDGDIKLQRASADLLTEFETRLPVFLRKPTPPAVDKQSLPATSPVRRTVRRGDTDRLIQLVCKPASLASKAVS